MFFPRCAAHQPETYRSSRYDISMAWHDQKPETIRFTDHQRNWKKDFLESFKIYGDWMLCEAEDGERAAEIVAKPKGGPADMEMDGRGLPLLPELSTVVGQPSRQATIRKLFNMHYGESHKPGHLGCRKLTLAIARASGTKNQSVPWKTLIADKRKAFTAHVLPDRIALHEPSKMDQDVVENLWSHILELQKNEDPEDQFHFSHFLRGDEWLPARYDAEVAPRQKPGRKRPKTARGPPGLRQLPTADECEQDDNGEEGEDNRDLRGQGGAAVQRLRLTGLALLDRRANQVPEHSGRYRALRTDALDTRAPNRAGRTQARAGHRGLASHPRIKERHVRWTIPLTPRSPHMRMNRQAVEARSLSTSISPTSTGGTVKMSNPSTPSEKESTAPRLQIMRSVSRGSILLSRHPTDYSSVPQTNLLPGLVTNPNEYFPSSGSSRSSLPGMSYSHLGSIW